MAESWMKRVLKVYGLPNTLEEGDYVHLESDLVYAIANNNPHAGIEEEDVLILFPSDVRKPPVVPEMLIEYQDTARYYENRETRSRLAAQLGYAVKRHFPAASIQCIVVSSDGKARHHWNSNQMVQREMVVIVHERAEALLPDVRRVAVKQCYCEANHADFRGPCSHHNALAAYESVVNEGASILAMGDDLDFQPAADLFMHRCRNNPQYAKLWEVMGWADTAAQTRT